MFARKPRIRRLSKVNWMVHSDDESGLEENVVKASRYQELITWLPIRSTYSVLHNSSVPISAESYENHQARRFHKLEKVLHVILLDGTKTA
jgi:hypothetical protein